MKHQKKSIARFLIISLLIIVMVFLINCESNEMFYRPDLPEKLCSIGIIDANDTILRHISFEKSFQIEYPEEVNDSLRQFSFSISSSGGELFSYHSGSTIKNIKDLRIPENITFNPGEKYYLRAKEKDTPEISAEGIVPEPSSELTLISINKETITVTPSQECRRPFDDIFKYAIIDFSFNGDNEHISYYAILLEGTGMNYSLPPGISGFLDFSIRESNVPGFFAVMHGLKMYHQICIDKRLLLNETPVFAYFIDGSKIHDNKCDITLSVKFHDGYSLFDIFTSFRVKLLSVPRELYLFEKSLYTYSRVSEDPFSEPVYLNGNIKNGNGIFAICRSTEISIILPFPPVF